MSAAHQGPAVRLVETFRTRLLAKFSWNILAAVALQGSVLLSMIVVARLLGVATFGAYALVVTTVMTAATVAQAGAGLVATKFVAERLGGDPRRVAGVLLACRLVTLLTGAVAALVLLLFAGMIADAVLGRAELAGSVRLGAIAVLFQVSAVYQSGALQGFGAFRELARTGLVAGAAHIALTGGGAALLGIDGALLGFAASSALRSALFAWTLRRVRADHGIPATAPLDRRELAPVWRFAVPAGLAGWVTMPCLWLAMVAVARMPDGMTLVALLSAAHQLRAATLQIPSLLNGVSFSVLSRLKGDDDVSGVRRVFWTALAVNMAFSAALVTLLAAVAGPLLNLYGSSFGDGRTVLVLLLVSVLPETLAMSLYQWVQSSGRMWRSLLLIAVPRDLGYLAWVALLLPPYGVSGAAGAYLAAQACGLVATLWIVRDLGRGLERGVPSQTST